MPVERKNETNKQDRRKTIMTDKINELKALIETIAEDSPLRKQLQNALDEEMGRMGEKTDGMSGESSAPDAEEASTAESVAGTEESAPLTLERLDEICKNLETALEEMEKSNPSTLTGKLEKLMEDDEFITASAGFVLGAAVTGLSALAICALKR